MFTQHVSIVFYWKNMLFLVIYIFHFMKIFSLILKRLENNFHPLVCMFFPLICIFNIKSKWKYLLYPKQKEKPNPTIIPFHIYPCLWLVCCFFFFFFLFCLIHYNILFYVKRTTHHVRFSLVYFFFFFLFILISHFSYLRNLYMYIIHSLLLKQNKKKIAAIIQGNFFLFIFFYELVQYY